MVWLYIFEIDGKCRESRYFIESCHKIDKIKRTRRKHKNQMQLCNTGSYSRVEAHLMKIKGIGVQFCNKISPKICKDLPKRVVRGGK